MNKKYQLVIPAAGQGSRFVSVGINIPKPIIPVIGIPMLYWALSSFNMNNVSKLVLITRDDFDVSDICDQLRERFDTEISILQLKEVTQGPAETALLAASQLKLDEPLVIANSDQFVASKLSIFQNSLYESDGTILTMNASGTKWSYVRRAENLDIVDVKEKVEISKEATVGIYGWKKARYFLYSARKMIQAEDRTNGEFYIAPTYNYLIEENLRISGINIGNVETSIFGLGTPEDLDLFEKNIHADAYRKQVISNFNLLV